VSLLSALDDVMVNTLSVIPGLLNRLEYLSGLKGMGGYSHWGLSRIHGERATQAALSDAHELLLSEVLRTPLRKLSDDVAIACAGSERVASAYLDELYRNYPSLLPDQVGGGSVRHFSSVLHALSALAAAQPLSTRPAA
jgi:hypothetical protein